MKIKALIILFLFLWSAYAYDDNEIIHLEIGQKFQQFANNTDKNTYDCEYNFASISYAFAWTESNNGTKWSSSLTNNRWGMHPWGRFYHTRQWSVSKTNERLRIYDDIVDAGFDFLYLYYYGYGCNLDQKHINVYVNGNQKLSGKRKMELEKYRRTIINRARYFEEKYFQGDGVTEQDIRWALQNMKK